MGLLIGCLMHCKVNTGLGGECCVAVRQFRKRWRAFSYCLLLCCPQHPRTGAVPCACTALVREVVPYCLQKYCGRIHMDQCCCQLQRCRWLNLCLAVLVYACSAFFDMCIASVAVVFGAVDQVPSCWAGHKFSEAWLSAMPHIVAGSWCVRPGGGGCHDILGTSGSTQTVIAGWIAYLLKCSNKPASGGGMRLQCLLCCHSCFIVIYSQHHLPGHLAQAVQQVLKWLALWMPARCSVAVDNQHSCGTVLCLPTCSSEVGWHAVAAFRCMDAVHLALYLSVSQCMTQRMSSCCCSSHPVHCGSAGSTSWACILASECKLVIAAAVVDVVPHWTCMHSGSKSVFLLRQQELCNCLCANQDKQTCDRMTATNKAVTAD
jgi:hypothetical protein